MPSLMRFLVVLSLLAGASYGGLYVLASKFEPEQQDVTKPLPAVRIKR